MKKVIFYLLLLCFSLSINAQVLNQSAAWPNTNWTVTGVYNEDPTAFESDPTLTSNFAFDDDDAGGGSDDDIAAESPVINLSAAFGAGETWIFLDVDYTYNDLGDVLNIEYWDADSSTWVAWQQFEPSAEQPTNDFCGGARDNFTSDQLNIAGFTGTQLSGFQYRIAFYDDGPGGGAGYEWGFCFDSPTITSQTPPSCPDVDALTVTNLTSDSADLIWTETGSATTWNVEWGATDFALGTGTALNAITSNPYNLTGLSQNTSYDFYVQAICGSDTSTFIGPFSFTTELQSNFTLDCTSGGPLTEDYCYENGGANNPFILTFTSNDGTALNLNFNSGSVENNWDELVVLDSDGTPFDGFAADDQNYGAAGDISGLTFQSTGDTISFFINSDGTISCGSGSAALIGGINYTVSCATCISPVATSVVRQDCINGPQFFVDVDITDLGSATSLNVSDNQGSTPVITSTLGVITFGPFANGTLIETTVINADDANCSIISGDLTQEQCAISFLDCVNGGPLTEDYCYENGGANDPFILTFTSIDGTALNLNFNSGSVENNWDELVVLDSDGTPFDGFAAEDDNYGDAGDISGLTFQSTGDTISFFINSDGIFSCGSGSADLVGGINYTVSCATCINPQATYTVIDDCENGDQFLIDVNIGSLGDASSLTISNNLTADTTPVTTTNTYQVGPFPFNEDVIITISNDQDSNCVINSSAFVLLACPPANDNPCEATVAIVNDSFLCVESTPGTLTAATDSGVPSGSCGGDPDDDVWFQFVAEDEFQLISLANFPAFENIDHALYSGTCDNLVELNCVAFEYSMVTPSLTIGDTYFVRVFSGGSAPESINFDLCITPYVAPTNISCDLAIPYCSGSDASDILYSYNTLNIEPGDGQIDCLFTTPNPTYSLLQIGSSGDILIEMVQNSAFDANDDPIGDELDVDFILWGPYAEGEDLCNLASVVDCSYSAAPVEDVTLLGAQQGEFYLLLITNYESEAGLIQVRQTNVGGEGSGSTIADIEAAIISNEVVFADTDSDPLTPVEANVCGFASVTILADSPFADEYIWLKDGVEMPDESSSTLIVTESNNYQLQVFDNQCGTFALSQLVVINLYEDAGTVAPQTLSVCDGSVADGVEAFDLDALSTSLGFGAGFTVSYYTTVADANQTINAVTSPYNSSGETLIIRVEDTDAATNGYLGCRSISDVELVVNSRPIINQPLNFIVCDDLDGSVDGITDFDLTSLDDEVNTDTGIIITYHTSQDDADNAVNSLTSPYSSAGETIFVRAELTSSGCFETTSFDVGVNIVPIATFDAQYDYEVCPNAIVPVEIGLVPTNFTADQVRVQWFLDDVLIPDETDLILPSVLLQGEYRAQIEFNDTGCISDVISTTVIELESCVIPQGISPGVSPGLNDAFDLSSYDVTKLKIFNRNGTLVYSKTNYTNEWVGQTNDGEELPVGTYFYVMEYEGGNKKRSAWIYINR
jgi:gliding motility-associated-like protein